MPPPKPSAKGGVKGAESPGITGYADSLTGKEKTPLLNETTGKPVPKVESATRLWSHALSGEPQREEIFKTQVVPALVALLERGAPEERWAACGALYALAQSEKHITEVVTTKVISCTSALLSSPHDRSHQPAAQLLAFLAQRLEYSSRVSDLALLPLLGCCASGAITAWGGARITALHAVTALRALIENVQGEAPLQKVARRNALIAAGAIPILVGLVTYVPRLPEPRLVPANPPVPGKKGSGAASAKGKKAGDLRPPAGRKDMIATHAAACLRFLALCPHFQEELIACNSLSQLVRSLLTDSAEQQAYVCGILWELTADVDVAQQVCDHDGVKCMLHVVASNLGGVKGKSKAKKKSDGQGSSKKSDKMEVTPANYCEIAVCNAAGALHHLTFLDVAKAQLGVLNGANIMLPCLKLSNVQAFENATGVLWNVGLHPANTNMLLTAGVPSYLSRPVPLDWMVLTDEDGQTELPLPQLDAHAHAGPSFFLTQAN